MLASVLPVVVVAILLFGGVTLHAQTVVPLVVPNAQTDVAGNIDNTYPFDIGSSTMRYQQVYAASQFGELPAGGGFVTAIAFRLHPGWSSFSNVLSAVQINLSTTSKAPGGLSTTFAANVGANNTVVYNNGALSLASANIGNPPEFDIVIPLTTPFLYNPAAGNLLLDVRNSGGGTTSPFDADSTNSAVSRLRGGVSDTTGATDNIGLVTEFIFTFTNTYLPVYQVTQVGATFSQAFSLASSLNIPSGALSWSNGVAAFIDPTNFLFVPTVQVTNAAILSNLLAVTKNPYPAIPISVQAIDFNTLSNLQVFDTNTALTLTTNALVTAGLNPAFGQPAISHAVFSASYTNTDGIVSSVSQYLDTEVNYQFTEAGGHMVMGPGAQAQFCYGPTGNVTRLYYATRQMAAGPLVQVIPESEASNRIAGLLPANAQINMQLVYYCPPFQPILPCSDCAANWNPTNILPWYEFTGTYSQTNPVTGSNYTQSTELQMIPATDDTNFVPTVSLLATGGVQVAATALAAGGRPPYIYLWSGSGPGMFTNDGPSVAYAPSVRVIPPSLAIAASNASLMASWPYPSTGFVLETATNLAAPVVWTETSSPVNTNSGVNIVMLTNSGNLFLRLHLVAQTLPETENVGVTVMDADGVMARTNLVLTVLATPLAPNGADPPVTYGTEDPYNAGGFDADDAAWRANMAFFGGGTERFWWSQYSALPGDFENNIPLGTIGSDPPVLIPGGIAGPNMSIDGDFANFGINTANMVMYLGHGITNGFSFTWPNFTPLDGSPANSLILTQPGLDMFMDYFQSNGSDWYTLLPEDVLGWGNMGPNDVLDWLCFDSCDVLAEVDVNGISAWARWYQAFNGLHIMLGYDNESIRPSGAPAQFAAFMLKGPLIGFSGPQSIVKAWFEANAVCDFSDGDWSITSAAMGPVTTDGVSDVIDFYPGKGPDGPSIPQTQIAGHWYLKHQPF